MKKLKTWLIVGLLAVATLLSLADNAFAQTTGNYVTGDQRSGQFSVAANLETGVTLTNKTNQEVKVNLSAEGTWSVSNDIKNLDANGLDPKYLPSDSLKYLQYPDKTPFSLVAASQDKDQPRAYQVGTKSELTIAPGATFAFLANDIRSAVVPDSYKDNTGSIVVKWSTPSAQKLTIVPASFANATNFAVGDKPTSVDPISVAIGDINGDGKLDLVTANKGSRNVSLLLGNGNGTFQSATNLSAGSDLRSVAISDINGDSKLDLVTADWGSNDVSVFLGNGDGTFQSATNFPVLSRYSRNSYPSYVESSDVNGDGKLDLVTANWGSNDVSVFLGNGDGTFQSATNFPVGTGPRSVASGDFNGDGKVDLVAANSEGRDVSLLLGNGNGTFQSATKLSVGIFPSSVVTGDVNEDGKLDLITANYGSASKDISLLLGNDNGTFQSATNFPVLSGPLDVATGDFNGDSLLDLVTANYNSANISILLGDGNGSFKSATNFSVGGSPYSLATGDVNGDGKLDLVTANFGNSNVSVLLNNGTFK